MAEETKNSRDLEQDLKKVEEAALSKQLRHRVDEYIAIILGVGAVLVLWFLQVMGVY
jgi:hypothetical protein